MLGSRPWRGLTQINAAPGPAQQHGAVRSAGADMTDTATEPAAAPLKLWVRLLITLLLGVAFQLAAWVLVAVALLQAGFAAFTGQPNVRLQVFGFTLGRYLAQIASFASFSSDVPPFPFSDWPRG
jgi:hypothetical protein